MSYVYILALNQAEETVSLCATMDRSKVVNLYVNTFGYIFGIPQSGGEHFEEGKQNLEKLLKTKSDSQLADDVYGHGWPLHRPDSATQLHVVELYD